MGWKDLFRAKGNPLRSDYITELNGSIFYGVNAASDVWNLELQKAFLEVPEVNAVLNQDAAMYSNMKLKVVNSNGEEIQNDLSKLLTNPNWFQSQKEYLRQSRLFRNIYGNEYIYFLAPTAMNANVKGMFTLPPNKIDISYKADSPFFLNAVRPENIIYTIEVAGRKQPLELENIIHLNDNRIRVGDLSDEEFLKGTSKLKPLSCPINNIRAAYESRNIILVTRGANGILSNAGTDAMSSTVQLDPKEKERLQKEYKNYGTQAGQSQLIITNMALQWQQMGVNKPKDLGLFEETRLDFDKIIDAYGHKREMYVSEKGSTFENQAEAEKNVYTNTIIPSANEFVFALNQRLTEGKPYNIIASYDHLAVFSEDLKDRAETLGALTNALSTLFQDGAIDIKEYQTELAKLNVGNE